MKNYAGIFFSLFLIVSVSAVVFAQKSDDPGAAQNTSGKLEKAAEKAVVRLQQKILLSDNQTSDLKTVVFDYIKTKENLSSSSKLFSRMVKIMDSRQKIKFEIIRDDWWKNLVAEVSN